MLLYDCLVILPLSQHALNVELLQLFILLLSLLKCHFLLQKHSEKVTFGLHAHTVEQQAPIFVI